MLVRLGNLVKDNQQLIIAESDRAVPTFFSVTYYIHYSFSLPSVTKLWQNKSYSLWVHAFTSKRAYIADGLMVLLFQAPAHVCLKS